MKTIVPPGSVLAGAGPLAAGAAPVDRAACTGLLDATAGAGPPSSGDSAASAFAAMYRREQPDVLRFIERRLIPPDAARAEDLAQETFLTAWRRWDDVPADPPGARAWLFTVARNCLLNEYQTHKRKAALQVRIAANAQLSIPGPEADTTQQLGLAAAWQTLTPADQEVIALTVWENLTSAQAGQVLGISGATYRIRLHRARNALRKTLESQQMVT